MRYWDVWQPRPTVAERKRKAEREVAKLQKGGVQMAPVVIAGRTIASTFWGKSWCENLERYSDYSNRLPRGRSYVRSGSVLDLQIEPGRVTALVSGSRLYQVAIVIKPVAEARWKAICKDCSGAIDSLVELLQGRLSKPVMERLCQQNTGLFPSPKEIQLACSCPDWADMCKHVAAVLYGIGARLDRQPELLFRLNCVDENELIVAAGKDIPLSVAPDSSGRVLDVDADLSAMFGLDLDVSAAPASPRKSGAKKVGPPKEKKAAAGKKTSAKKLPPATKKAGAKKTRRAVKKAGA